jgi:hypothetical protein
VNPATQPIRRGKPISDQATLKPRARRRMCVEELDVEICGHHRPARGNALSKPERDRSPTGPDLQAPLPRTNAQPRQVVARARVNGRLEAASRTRSIDQAWSYVSSGVE